MGSPIPLIDYTSIRVVSYNVHSCIGIDRQRSPSRVAQVLTQCKPDIVFLQEVEKSNTTAHYEDQSHYLAQELGFYCVFKPSWSITGEKSFGNTILSRFPLNNCQVIPLPTFGYSEARTLLWCRTDWAGRKLDLLNTHLSLRKTERMLQLATILGNTVLQSPEMSSWVIFGGDLNTTKVGAFSKSEFPRLLSASLLCTGKVQPTWESRFPIRAIDHILVSDNFHVENSYVFRSPLSRIASDHLPLVVQVTSKP